MKKLLKSLRLKKVIVTYLILFVALSGVGLLFLFNPWNSNTQAAWFNDGWSYRKKIDITTHTDDESSVYVSFTIDTATPISEGKMQADCGDLRFTTFSGEILEYYIPPSPGCDDAATDVHVNFQFFPEGAQTIYYYYGNSSAANGGALSNFPNQTPSQGSGTLTINDSGDDGDQNTNGLAGDITRGQIRIGNDSNPKISGFRFIGLDIQQGAIVNSATLTLTGQGTYDCGGCTLTANIYAEDVDDSAIFTAAGSNISGRTKTSASVSTGSLTSVTADQEYSYDVVTVVQEVVDRGSWSVGNDLAILIQDNGSTSSEWQDFYSYDGDPAKAATLELDWNTADLIIGSSGSEEKGPSPIAFWQFDEGQGTTVNNATGGGSTLNGTLSGATWLSEDQCVSGKCLRMDGSNDYVTVTDPANGSLDFGTAGDFSISLWIRSAGATDSSYIMAKYNTGNAPAYAIQVVNNHARALIRDGVGTGSNEVITLEGSTNIQDSQWHQITITADRDGNMSLYVDGKLDATPTSISTISDISNSEPIYFGRRGAGNYFKGDFDEPKIYNFVLSSDQIKANYTGAGIVMGVNTQNASALSDGLVGYWKLDESATPSVDSSGNGFSGTWGASASSGVGKFGSALSLDATDNSYVNNTSFTGVSSVNRWAVSIWFKTSDTDGYLFDNRKTSTNFGVGIYTDGSNTINMFVQNIDNTSYYKHYTYAVTSTDNAWHHAVVTRDGENSVNLYIDGIKLTPSVVTTDNDMTGVSETWSAFHLGHRYTSNIYNYSGLLDEYRIYNRALSGAEVSQLYKWAPGPVGFWKMDEKTGTTANDSSGNGNTGTLTNSPTWQNGKYGGAVDYLSSANNQYISVANSSSLNDVPALTISGWIKYRDQGVSSIGTILSKENSGGTSGYVFRMHGSGNHNLRFTVQHGTTDLQRNTNFGLSAGVPICGSTVSGAESGWCHVAVTWDGTTSATGIRIYLNGVEAPYSGSVDGVGARQSDASDTLRIGQNGNVNRSFNGKTDDMKVYNYVRTQAQIIEDMNGGHPAPGSPISSAVSHWKFDEGYGTTANDSTPNDNDLTLNTATSAWTNNAKFSKGWVGLGTNWMSRADDSDLDFAATDDGTFSMWFKSTSTTNPGATEYLLSKGPGSTAAGYAIYANTSGQICFGIDDDTTFGPDDSSCSTADIYDGTFHHIAAVKTGTSSIQLFVDGKAQTADSSISATGTLANSSILYVGDFNGSDNGNEFNGTIDEIKVYRSALTVTQIALDLNQSSAQTVGSLSSTQTQPNAASSLYCIPGDATACDSPVGEWRFDEGLGTTANDSSGNSNTGTLQDAPVYRNGKINKAILFDNSSQRVSITGSSSTMSALDTNFTIEAWINPSANESGHYISKRGTGQVIWDIHATSGTARFFLRDADSDQIDATFTMTAGVWNHVSAVKSGTSVTVYLNGNPVATGSNGSLGSVAGTGDLGIGAEATSSNPVGGLIDNVLIYNYARTPAQIAWDYNQGKPVAHYQFDECQGTAINNSIGNSLHGVLTNAGTPGTCTTSGSWFNGVAGKNNYSLDFDGTDDYVQIPYNAALNPKVITISAWIKPGSYSNWNKVISTDYRGDGSWSGPFVSYAMGFYASGGAALFEITTGGSKADAISSTILNTGSWYHLVGTYDGTNMRLYVNGKLETTTSKSGDIDYNSETNDITIARASHYVNENPFDGQVDDVRIYNYPLTDLQVKNLYTDNAAYKTGPVTGAP